MKITDINRFFVHVICFALIGLSCEFNELDEENSDSSSEDLSPSVLSDTTLYEEIHSGEYSSIDYTIISLQRTSDSVFVEVGFSGCSPDHEFQFIKTEGDEESEVSMALMHLGPGESCQAFFTKLLAISVDEIDLDDHESLALLHAYDLEQFYLYPNYPGLIQFKEIEVMVERPACQPTEFWFEVINASEINENFDRFSFTPMNLDDLPTISQGETYSITVKVLPWSVFAGFTLCEMYEGPYLPVEVLSISGIDTGTSSAQFDVLSLQRTSSDVILNVAHSGCEQDDIAFMQQSVDSSLSQFAVRRAGLEQDCDAYFSFEVKKDIEDFLLTDDQTLVLINAHSEEEYYLPPNLPGLIQGVWISVEVQATICKPNDLWFVSDAPNAISPELDKFSFLPMMGIGDMSISVGQIYQIKVQVLPWSVLANVTMCDVDEGAYLPVTLTGIQLAD